MTLPVILDVLYINIRRLKWRQNAGIVILVLMEAVVLIAQLKNMKNKSQLSLYLQLSTKADSYFC